MKGDVPNIERVAIQFHVLGASDGCLLAVGKSNILNGSSATSNYANSKSAQAGFMSTILSYKREDKKNGYSNSINVSFDRLHDNPNYENEVIGNPTSVPTEWHPPLLAPVSSDSQNQNIKKATSVGFLNIYTQY